MPLNPSSIKPSQMPTIPPYHRMVGLIGTKPASKQATLREAATASMLLLAPGFKPGAICAAVEGSDHLFASGILKETGLLAPSTIQNQILVSRKTCANNLVKKAFRDIFIYKS